MKPFWISCAVCSVLSGTPALAEFESPVAPSYVPGGESGADVKLRASAGYNSNVQYFNDFLLPLDIDPGSAFGGLTLNVNVWHMVAPAWTVGASLRLDGVGFLDDVSSLVYPAAETESDYNYFALHPTFWTQYRTALEDGTGVIVDASVGARSEVAPGVEGIGELAILGNAAVTLDVPGPLAFKLSGNVARDDFSSVWQVDPANSTRDGVQYGLNAAMIYDLGLGPIETVSVNIGAQANDASGANWDYGGLVLGAGLTANLLPGLSAEFGLSYAHRSYGMDFTSVGWFTPPGRDWQSVTTLDATLIWQVMPRVAADFGVSHQMVNSNSSEFTGSRTIATAGVTVDVY